jgi:hypothetical protein
MLKYGDKGKSGHLKSDGPDDEISTNNLDLNKKNYVLKNNKTDCRSFGGQTLKLHKNRGKPYPF